MYASLGRYEEASEIVSQITTGGNFPAELVADAMRFLRSAPAKVASPDTLPPLRAFGYIYLHIGAPERALEFYEDCVAADTCNVLDFSLLWHPSYAPVRKMERFKRLVRDAGLVDYWKTRGWPDLCRPVGTNDFVCE